MSDANIANLNKYNILLAQTIEELRKNQGILQQQVAQAQEQKSQLESRISQITTKLNQLNCKSYIVSIEQKKETREEYDKAMVETQNAYKKIVQGSHTLLKVLKRESVHLSKQSED